MAASCTYTGATVSSVPALPLPWGSQNLTSTARPCGFQLGSDPGLWFSRGSLNSLRTFSFQIPLADPPMGLHVTYFTDWTKGSVTPAGWAVGTLCPRGSQEECVLSVEDWFN